MTNDQTSELFPILAESEQEFEVVMRGYDRRQVDGFVARVEAELAALTTERDSALSRSADLAAQLANSHAQIESIRRRLAETTGEITPENVHARVRPIVELAQAEARGIRESVDSEATHLRMLADADAAETRRQAAVDAERMRAQAQADLHRATDAARQREADADRTLAAAQATAAEQLNRARDEAERMLAQTHAEIDALTMHARMTRDRLDNEAAAKRVLANEDFEIALRVRRTEEQRVDDERHAAAVAEAERLVAEAKAEQQRIDETARAESARTVREANAEAERVIREASARVQQLADLQERVHSDLMTTHDRMGQVLIHSARTALTPITAVQPVAVDPGIVIDAEPPPAIENAAAALEPQPESADVDIEPPAAEKTL
jgi:DivIVA domain-containing protein